MSYLPGGGDDLSVTVSNVPSSSFCHIKTFRESLRYGKVEKCKAIVAGSHSEPDYQRLSKIFTNASRESFRLQVTFNNCGRGGRRKRSFSCSLT